jgi:hypothetical protein
MKKMTPKAPPKPKVEREEGREEEILNGVSGTIARSEDEGIAMDNTPREKGDGHHFCKIGH